MKIKNNFAWLFFAPIAWYGVATGMVTWYIVALIVLSHCKLEITFRK